MVTAMRVIADRAISGPQHDWGTADAGLPTEGAWPYDTRVKAGNEGHSPPPESRERDLYQSNRWGNPEGEAIRVANASQAIVGDLRNLLYRQRVPIVVGLTLYASFDNPYARRTGRITLPLDGDQPIGGHAMLVVGFDDNERTFLVRNSWGTGWAYGNPWHLADHALIPYAYFTRYASGCYSMRNILLMKNVHVPPPLRLYNQQTAAARQSVAALHGRLAGQTAGSRSRAGRDGRRNGRTQAKKGKGARRSSRKPSLLSRLLGRG